MVEPPSSRNSPPLGLLEEPLPSPPSYPILRGRSGLASPSTVLSIDCFKVVPGIARARHSSFASKGVNICPNKTDNIKLTVHFLQESREDRNDIIFVVLALRLNKVLFRNADGRSRTYANTHMR